MKLKLIPMLALASGLTLATVACSKNDSTGGADATATDTTTPATTETTAAADHASQFLTDVIQTNNAEIKFGQAAQDMGSTQAVRDFGKMLVDDHTKANNELVQLANAKKIELGVIDRVSVATTGCERKI